MFYKTPTNNDFGGYLDNNTLHTYSSNKESLLHNLEEALGKMFHWFQQIT